MTRYKKEYSPGLDEIRARVEAYDWMKVFEWPEDVMDEIFYRDNPNLQTVREMVYRHGPDKALRLIKSFM